MADISEIFLDSCKGPLEPLIRELPSAPLPLSRWKAPQQNGSLDHEQFKKAYADVNRDADNRVAAARLGKRLRDAIDFCRISAACHAMETSREVLDTNRVLLIAPHSECERNAERRQLIHDVTLRFPDTTIYVHSGQYGVESALSASDGVKLLPLSLDIGQLSTLFDRAFTVCLSTGLFLQCCGVVVAASQSDRLLPTDQHEADIWLHLLFDKLATHLDPATGLPVPAIDTVTLVVDQLRQHRLNRVIAAFAGIRSWKKKTVAAMFSAPAPARNIHLSAQGIPTQAHRAGGALAAWAPTVENSTIEECKKVGISLLRMEDGFVRSVGLGAAGFQSLSFVLDDLGMHYDPREPSRIERILQTAEFNEAVCARANRLIESLVEGRLTKYNLDESVDKLSIPLGKRVIFVPGQVADDASLTYGGANTTCQSLLATAREMNPDAFIIYKPHPDVVNGLRQGFADGAQVLKLADLYVENHSTLSLIASVDEIHTISSLTGFEALLRGRKVVCHGQPFYSGWGLTQDLVPVTRRTRKLTLNELVAGSLIFYPHYIDPLTGRNTSPETVIARILKHKKEPPTPDMLMKVSWLFRRTMRQLKVIAVGKAS